MMGEFGAESIQSEMANSPTFFCLFALFLVIIAMVLLNLLTGLAVSDTEAIKSDAKRLSVVSRIRLIYEIESTLLQWYTFLEKCSKCTLLHPFINSQKSKIKNSSLFPDTSHKKRIHVLPNQGQKFVFEGDGLYKDEDGDELDNGHGKQAYEGSKGRDPHIRNISTKHNGHNTSCKMTSVIIGEATRIISKRSQSDVNDMKGNFSQIAEAIKENESKLSKMQYKMEANQQLLQELSEKITYIEKVCKMIKINAK